MTEPINIRFLEPRTRIRLPNNATGEVVTNFNDGVWVSVRFLTSPDDPSWKAPKTWSLPRTCWEFWKRPSLTGSPESF